MAHPGGVQTYYGEGFTLKYEPNDSNRLHFLSLGFDQNAPYDDVPIHDGRATWTLYQMRVPTRSSGVVGSPFTYSNWPVADIATMKCYNPHGSTGGYQAKRLFYFNDPNPATLPQLFDYNTGRLNLKWVESSGRLYQCYSFGYTTISNSPHLMWMSLDYSDPTTYTCDGPWGLNGIGYKANSGWVDFLPAAFASAAGVSGRRLVVGGGRYTSQAGSGDVSMGVSGVVTDETFPSTGNTPATMGYIADYTHLAGYWPTVNGPTTGYGRSTRPTGHIPPGRSDVNFANTWGDGYFTDYDWIAGGRIIDTGTCGGLLVIARLNFGQASYNSSYTYGEYVRDYALIYSLDDVAAVLAGTKNRWDIQPVDWWEMQWPMLDYTRNPFTPAAQQTIVAITAVGGADVGAQATGAIVELAAPFMMAAWGNNYAASIRGTTRPSEFHAIWNAVNCDAGGTETAGPTKYIRIWNTSIGSGGGGATWSGATATGGTLQEATPSIPFQMDVTGLEYDPVTKIVSIAVRAFVWGGDTATLFVNDYQLP